MIIPNLNKIKVSDENGNMHPELHELLSQIITALQQNLSDEGYKLPQQTTTNIIKLSNPKSKGAIIYDTDTDKFMVCINSAFRTVQVS